MPSSSDRLEVAVLLIVFNRPGLTRKTLEAIKAARPTRLYVVSDGPRKNLPGEIELVLESRRLVDEIVGDQCLVHKNYAELNMGCRRRIVTGINWAFEHEDRLIILEDDCLASQSFFKFCQDALNLYENDSSVFSISGSNFTNNSTSIGHFLSDYSLMWGWATWRNRWRLYVEQPTDYVRIVFRKWWKSPLTFLYWLNIFRRVDSGNISSAWDYQWILTHWRNNARSCRPSVNLVANIGFGAEATHTKSENRFLAVPVYQGCGRFTDSKMSSTEAVKANAADVKHWAMINIRTVLLLWIPGLKMLNKLLRGRG